MLIVVQVIGDYYPVMRGKGYDFVDSYALVAIIENKFIKLLFDFNII